MAEEDILASAASATQSMLPQQIRPLTSFGPQPLVQPPPMSRMNVTPPQVAQGGFASVGARKRADKQAMFNNVASMIKDGGDFIQAKKQRDLSMTIERLMSAQEGLEEAKGSGDQEAIKKNTAIINDITSDPKRVKMLQKAFNIDLFGNGKNKAENQALVEAYKSYNQKKQTDPSALNPIAQKMLAAQPQRQQLNPEAQAQAAAIKAGLIPKAGEILKATEENFKTILAAKTSEDRNIAIEDAAKLRAQAEQYHADKIYDAALQRILGSQAAAEIRARAQKYSADLVAKTWDKRLAKMDDWAKMKTGNSPFFKQLYGEATTYNNKLKSLTKENADLQKEIDNQSTGTIGKFFGIKREDTAEIKQKRQQIILNNLAIQQSKQNLDGVTQKMDQMNKLGIINMEELQKGNSGGDEGGEVTTVPDDEVPE